MGTTQQFGQRIRAIRQERGISQNALAKAAGITQGTLSKAEAGERFLSVEIMDKLAVVLGKEPRSLVEGTDAEGKYTAERLSPEEIQSHKANKAKEIHRNLSLLHLLYGRLYGLCSAVWSHGIGSGDLLHEVVRENIAEACEPVLHSLERLGYEEIRTKVQIPSSILDEPGTLPECVGESWEYEIEPSLVAGERWIVRELARFGGIMSADEIVKFVRKDIMKSLKEWDEHIKAAEDSNRDYMERLMNNAAKMRHLFQ